MAKIISIPKYIGKCRECGCRFECDSNELTKIDKALDEIGLKKIRCPNCSKEVWIDINLDKKERIELLRKQKKFFYKLHGE